MDRSLTLATGWNNLGTLLAADSYSGQYLVKEITVQNRTSGSEIVTYRQHTSPTTAPGSDSGQHLDPGDSLTKRVSTKGMPIDMKMIWLRNSGAGSISVDVSAIVNA